MLTGQKPLSDPEETSARMMRSRFRDVRRLADTSNLPLALVESVNRALSFRPRDRQPDYRTLIGELQEVAESIEQLESSNARDQEDWPRLMIVHRSAKTRELLREKLTLLGWQVAITDSLARAVTVLRLKPVDGLIVDLDTTGREGIDAYGELARRSAAPCHAVLLAQPEQLAWADELDETHVAVIPKPPTFRAVYDAIRRLVPPARSNRQGGPADVVAARRS